MIEFTANMLLCLNENCWPNSYIYIYILFNSEQHCCRYCCVSTGPYFTINVALLFQLPRVCYLDRILSLSMASMHEAMPMVCIQSMLLEEITTTVLITVVVANCNCWLAGYDMRLIGLKSQKANFRLGKFDH